MAQDSLVVKNYALTQLTMTPANTEVSTALTATRPLMVRISVDDLTSTCRISFTSGASGTGKRIFQGAEWTSPGFVMGSKTIYLQSPNAGAVAIIEEWDRG